MDRETARQQAAILSAYADGVPLQVNERGSDWRDLSVDEAPLLLSLDLYRVKPMAPARRPWQPEEVPVGALLREHADAFCSLPRIITEITNTSIYFGHDRGWDYARVFDLCEWKWPNEPESAWRRCGVPAA